MGNPGQKMVLVPLSLLQEYNKKIDVTALTDPNKNELIKSMREKEDILENSLIPNHEKAMRLEAAEKDRSFFANKVLENLNPSTTVSAHKKMEPIPEHFTSSLPKTIRTPAKNLLTVLQNSSIEIDPDTQEISISGEKLPGSNIQDLIGDLLRTRKTVQPPEHAENFLKTLAKINIPEEYIKNRNRIAQFREFKRQQLMKNFNGSSPPVKGRKHSLLSGKINKKRVFGKSKFPKKSLYKWKAI